jgi:hypothetical protein
MIFWCVNALKGNSSVEISVYVQGYSIVDVFGYLRQLGYYPLSATRAPSVQP